MSESEARLWSLVEERLAAPGADERARIDERIDDLFGEEWAILFTDLSGFSRSAQRFGIVHFLQVIHEQHRLLAPIIASHDGLLLRAEADSQFVMFRRAAAAIRCAVAMQQACQAYNRGRPREEQLLLCCGVGFGRVLRVGDHNVWGNEVNGAAKLGEDIATTDEVLVTAAAREAAGDLEGLGFAPATRVSVPCSPLCYRVLYAGPDGEPRGAGPSRGRPLAEVALFTPAVEPLAAFYRVVLNAEPRHAGPSIAVFAAGDATLLIHERMPHGPGEPPCEDHVAFGVRDLDRAAAALRDAGYALEVGPATFDWGRSAYVRDPEGRLVELSEER